MKNIKKGGLGSDMGSLLERKENTIKTCANPEEIDIILIEDIYNKIKKQPRISFWDLESKTLLNYLKETQPKFSISKEISNILHEHFQKNHPEIWAKIKETKNNPTTS
jgi:hypothetical protein